MGVPSRDIKAVTGHKSEESIEHYSKTPDSLRQNMSMGLAGVPSATVTQSQVQVNKVVKVEQHPQPTNVMTHATFSNCTINIQYK